MGKMGTLQARMFYKISVKSFKLNKGIGVTIEHTLNGYDSLNLMLAVVKLV